MFTSINNLDKQLTEKYPDFTKKNGFFIEAGANDGVLQSNTYYFENQLDWKGILIEPIPQVFVKCKKNRNANNIFINAALVNEAYTDSKIIMEYTPTTEGLMSVAKGLPHSQKHLKKSLDEGVGVWTDVITLNKIFETFKNHIPEKIDFFSLDVEGYERQALTGCDFNKHYIKYILIEQQYYASEINKILDKHYKKIDQLSSHDYLWIRK